MKVRNADGTWRTRTVGKTTLLYADEYEGPRWVYALTLRPFGPFTVPKGFLVGPGALGKHPDHPYETVQYPRQLTVEEMEHYGLVLVDMLAEPDPFLTNGGD